MSTPRDVPPTSTSTDPSVAELVTRSTESLSELFRKEIALAKAETKIEARHAGVGAGMLAGAGILSLLTLGLVSLAASRWLSEVMDLGWAYLVVAGVWLLIAVGLALAGRSTLSKLNPTPEQTVETLREIPDALRGR
jgi:hypothetical protein